MEGSQTRGPRALAEASNLLGYKESVPKGFTDRVVAARRSGGMMEMVPLWHATIYTTVKHSIIFTEVEKKQQYLPVKL